MSLLQDLLRQQRRIVPRKQNLGCSSQNFLFHVAIGLQEGAVHEGKLVLKIGYADQLGCAFKRRGPGSLARASACLRSVMSSAMPAIRYTLPAASGHGERPGHGSSERLPLGRTMRYSSSYSPLAWPGQRRLLNAFRDRRDESHRASRAGRHANWRPLRPQINA